MYANTHFPPLAPSGQKMNRWFERMASRRRPERVDLEAGEVHAVEAGRRRRDVIRCLQGRMWLTQEGDLQDHLLNAGDVFFAAHAGRILVSALENTRVEVGSTRNGRC